MFLTQSAMNHHQSDLVRIVGVVNSSIVALYTTHQVLVLMVVKHDSDMVRIVEKDENGDKMGFLAPCPTIRPKSLPSYEVL